MSVVTATTTTTICFFAVLGVGGTCGLIVVLMLKELSTAEGQGQGQGQGKSQKPSLMVILKRLRVTGRLTIPIMYLLITLSLVAAMMAVEILSRDKRKKE
jgi:hypothetical protein